MTSPAPPHISVALPPSDRLVEYAQAAERPMDSGWTGDAGSIRSRLDEATAGGIGEVVFAPAGPAIVDELESFMEACWSGQS